MMEFLVIELTLGMVMFLSIHKPIPGIMGIIITSFMGLVMAIIFVVGIIIAFENRRKKPIPKFDVSHL